jgi:hypothetical protein
MPKEQIKRRRPSAAEKGAVQPAVEPSSGPAAVAAVSPAERRRMIAEAAYFRAERRGFALGGGLDDWIAAETEIDRLAELGGSHSRHSLRHM